MTATTAIVTVNYASHRLLATNEALRQAQDEGLHVVVADSYSSAGNRDAVTALCADQGWQLVPLADNPGFGSAVNAAVAALDATVDTLVLLNPDASAPARTLSHLADAVRDDQAAIVAPRIVRPDGSTWSEGGDILVAEGTTRTAGVRIEEASHPWLSGACLAVSRPLWERLGGFDDDYFMYWEDVDLSYRCVTGGGRVVVRRDLVVVHDVGGTQGGGRAKSDLYYRYNCRNRLMFASKHLTADEIRGWISTAPSYARDVVLRGGRRQFIERGPGPLVSAARGSWEGYLRARRALR